MLSFGIALVIAFTTIMGLRYSYVATQEGETIQVARLTGLIRGLVFGAFALAALLAFYGYLALVSALL